MFYQTYTTRKQPKVPVTVQHSRQPVTPGSHRMVLSAAAHDLPCTAHESQCIVNGDDTAVSPFCPWWLWPLTLTFKLVRARDQTRLPCEFGAKKTKQAALKTEPCLHAVNSLKLNQKNAQNAKPKQCTKTKPKPTLTCKNYCIGAYHCAQLSYTTQHRTVLVLFPLILQTVRAQMMSTGGEDILW